MTTRHVLEALTSLVSDLARHLPTQQRYQRVLDVMRQIFPCDAAALLQLDGDSLEPRAISGLSPDTLGRRFVVAQQPRLSQILHSREPVRFPVDCELPDPYDGLVNTADQQLHVHDCMGVPLQVDEQPWGVLTLDALRPGTFDSIDPLELRAFIKLAEAAVKAANLIDSLETRAQHQQQIAKALISEGQSLRMVGLSAAMRRLQNEIATVAPSDLAVLVLGETGVGKELVAQQLHAHSQRAEQALVHVNCAALPESIVESELFGHVKGAFSGAVNARAGKFELADGGTLFLDEVGELPLAVQAKLLRALQSGEIQRVGSDRYHRVDVRIVAATNRSLQQEVAAGRFRADLYHRLSVYPIKVPPLRERRDDILPLAGHFLAQQQRRLGAPSFRLTPEAQTALVRYDWPGNVRELEHLISRAALKARVEQGQAEARVISVRQRHLDLQPPATEPAPAVPDGQRLDTTEAPAQSLKTATEQFQRQLIDARLRANDGNLAATARELQIDRSNFHRLLKRLGMR